MRAVSTKIVKIINSRSVSFMSFLVRRTRTMSKYKCQFSISPSLSFPSTLINSLTDSLEICSNAGMLAHINRLMENNCYFDTFDHFSMLKHPFVFIGNRLVFVSICLQCHNCKYEHFYTVRSDV